MKILCHLSGGIDSTASTLLVAESGNEFACFFVDYGQPYVLNEWRAALKIASRLSSFPNYKGLIHKKTDLECNSDSVLEYVPIRNLVIGALSANYALSKGYSKIAVGSKSVEKRNNDPYSFNDCTTSFWANMSTLCSVASEGKNIEFVAPLIKEGVAMTKKQAIEIILSHNIPLSSVWSCYNTNSHHCGKCYHCQEIIDTGYFPKLFQTESR